MPYLLPTSNHAIVVVPYSLMMSLSTDFITIITPGRFIHLVSAAKLSTGPGPGRVANNATALIKRQSPHHDTSVPAAPATSPTAHSGGDSRISSGVLPRDVSPYPLKVRFFCDFSTSTDSRSAVIG
ncbi:hypothetical protein J6590_034684 [Homalodisca vitripennis]|nr:hypothetical protein J6590_034684 [Homalodisca vitripennis]